MEKVEIIVTDCIREIKAGRATLAECLDRYPEKRYEIEPLLNIALNIQEPVPFTLDNDYKRAARVSLLQQIRTVNTERSEPFKNIRGFFIQPQFSRVRIAAFIVVAVIVISMLAGGTVYAAQGSLPGDLVYPVKTTSEDVRLFFTGDISDKAELNLEFARTRLEEMSKLANTSEGKIEITVQGYQSKLEAAIRQIRGITDTSTRTRMLERVLENLQYQTAFCDEVIDAAPIYAGPVREADNLSVNFRAQFMEMLSQDDVLQAVQMNMNAMENRLQRAWSQATGHQYQSMQQALDQFREFNRVAVQIVENTRSNGSQSILRDIVDSQTLSGYLGILDSMSQQVPGKYISDIETSREMVLQFQTQMYHEYQQKDGSGWDVDGKNSGNGKGTDVDHDNTGVPQNQGGDTGTDTETPGAGDAPGPGPGGSPDGSPSGSDSAPSPSPGPGESPDSTSGNGKTG